jgi:hypothetical protein
MMKKVQNISKRPGKTISKKTTYLGLVNRIAEILKQARTKALREINKAQVLAYWEIGREIVEFEQKGKARADYGEKLIKQISKDMTQKFGRGFSPTNLKMMRLFYQSFPIRQTLSDESKNSRHCLPNFNLNLYYPGLIIVNC